VLVRKHDDPQPLIAEGVWAGQILKKARGNNGFGYDPIFMDNMTGKSAAELTPEIKNKISHRGQALRKLLQLLERLD
jgi:XTP/dITP diphosphohydrolase